MGYVALEQSPIIDHGRPAVSEHDRARGPRESYVSRSQHRTCRDGTGRNSRPQRAKRCAQAAAGAAKSTSGSRTRLSGGSPPPGQPRPYQRPQPPRPPARPERQIRRNTPRTRPKTSRKMASLPGNGNRLRCRPTISSQVANAAMSAGNRPRRDRDARPVLVPGSLPLGPGSGDRRAGRRRRDRGKVAGERAELAPHGRRERGLDALVELLQGQPPLGVAARAVPRPPPRGRRLRRAGPVQSPRGPPHSPLCPRCIPEDISRYDRRQVIGRTLTHNFFSNPRPRPGSAGRERR